MDADKPVPEVTIDVERTFYSDIIAVRCNNDEDRARLIRFFDGVAVRSKPGFAQHPDLVNYHPNAAGFLGFRIYPNSEILLVLRHSPETQWPTPEERKEA